MQSQYQICFFLVDLFHSMDSRKFDKVEFRVGGDVLLCHMRADMTKHFPKNRILGDSVD